MLLLGVMNGWSQTSDPDTLAWEEQSIDEVQVHSRRVNISRLNGAQQGFQLNKEELFRAACCNLGEAFQNNASVDVNYSDAATGAKQIKLLGLSGTYVQMLTETQPNFFGAAKPYALDYVPGPWMNSIQVSKGASSVKHGYDGITGQINVSYLHPEDEEAVNFNAYGSTDRRFEVNADGNVHLTGNLFTNILMHYDTRWGGHDGNKDGFMDSPNSSQYNLQNRWKYQSKSYIFHGGISGLKEDRTFGQTDHHKTLVTNPWVGKIETERYEAYMKHAFVIDQEHNENIAFMANGAIHNQDAAYGERFNNIDQKDLVAKIMYETEFNKTHSFSTGLSMDRHWYDYSRMMFDLQEKKGSYGSEGLYVQYTMNLRDRLVLMAGLRADATTHVSFEKDIIVTPRVHVKYQVNDWMQVRASVGKGYKLIDSFWAENSSLLATGRNVIDLLARREEAWNFGGTVGFDFPLWNKNLKINTEYFYTHFINQAVIDYDSAPGSLIMYDSKGFGGNYSHVFQIDASYEPVDGLSTSLAFRRNIVKSMGRDKVFQSKYKGLFTASYKPGLGLWQFDGSVQLNGPCRIPDPTSLAVSEGTIIFDEPCVYPAVNLQATRWFRHWSVYVGCENLTNFTQKHPIIGAGDPWGNNFDATQVWGPVMGRMFYAGVRVKL